MKINAHQIPAEGLVLEEEFSPSALSLETEAVRFKGPIKAKANITKITNAVTVDLVLSAKLCLNCSRCLNEFTVDLRKSLKLSCPVDKSDSMLDLDKDIREEIILDYPIKPLCDLNCKGLCPKCGNNLNEGGCSCGVT